ncbi:MAG: hypothetical protein ACOZCP_08215 [Pseudomonadota bacterium]
MKRNRLVAWAVAHPKAVLWLVLLVTAAFVTQLPRIRTDTNPKNMLPTSDVRVWTDAVDQTFALYFAGNRKVMFGAPQDNRNLYLTVRYAF